MRGRTSLTKVALASSVLLLAGACAVSTGTEDDDSLRAAELRWLRAGVQDYQIVVQNACFCGYTRPVRVTVRMGSVVSRVDAETGEAVPPQGVQGARDVPQLFALIRDAIMRDAYSLSVTYDATYGFPTQINIDYIGNAIDDELSVKTSEFLPLR